ENSLRAASTDPKYYQPRPSAQGSVRNVLACRRLVSVESLAGHDFLNLDNGLNRGAARSRDRHAEVTAATLPRGRLGVYAAPAIGFRARNKDRRCGLCERRRSSPAASGGLN